MPTNGEITTIVVNSRRIVIGALLSPFTKSFKELALAKSTAESKKSTTLSSSTATTRIEDATITKEEFFLILRYGIRDVQQIQALASGTLKESALKDELENLQQGTQDSEGSKTWFSSWVASLRSNRAVRQACNANVVGDESLVEDLEFLWSEVIVLSEVQKLEDKGILDSCMNNNKKRARDRLNSLRKMHVDTDDDEQEGDLFVDNNPALDEQTKGVQNNDSEKTLYVEDAPKVQELDAFCIDKEAQGDARKAATVDLSSIESVAVFDVEKDEMLDIKTRIDVRLKKWNVTDADMVTIADVVRLCVASSPSPTISAEQAAAITNVLTDSGFQHHDQITRFQFVSLLKAEIEKPQGRSHLRNLDLEELALYLFPDLTVEVGVLRQLVFSCQLPSSHHGFASSYAFKKLLDWDDAKELLFYVPFLVLYLGIVLSGKYVTPRTYYGYDAVQYIKQALFSAPVSSCIYDTGNLTGCGSATQSMTAATVTSAVAWYTMMSTVLVPLLWPDDSSDATVTAAQTILSNNLRLVGALKMVSHRVSGENDTDLQARYFSNTQYQNSVLRFLPYSQAAYKSDIGIHPTLNAQSYKDITLAGFNGSSYASCDVLNATTTILGNTGSFPCAGYAAIIPFNTTRTQASTVINGLFRGKWLDQQAAAVVTEFVLFHDVSTMFVHVRMLTEFQVGGGVSSTFTAEPFTFYTLTSTQPTLNGLYYLYFVLLFFNVGRYILLNILRPLIFNDAFATLRLDRWFALDVANYAMFCASATSRILWMVQATPTHLPWEVEFYLPQYDDAEAYFTTVVTIDSFNILLSVLGLLRFNKFLPAVGLVVSALDRAMYDAFSLFLVIVGTFLSLVVCAAASFGDSVLGYHTVLYAAQSLGQVFIGNYDYTPLHAAHPSFSFTFFFVFQIIIAVVLLNMFVAVFTDAFSGAMSEMFDREVSSTILDNVAHNPIIRSTVATFAVGSLPLQVGRAMIRTALRIVRGVAVEEMNFITYDRLLAKMFNVLFSSDHKLRLTEPLQIAAARVERIHSTKVLLSLLDKVPIPLIQPSTVTSARARTSSGSRKGINGATNIFDFISDQVGHDYPLVMTFFVLIPQKLFYVPGEYLLDGCMSSYVAWRNQVELSSLKATEDDRLELRVRSILDEIEHDAPKRVTKGFASFQRGDATGTSSGEGIAEIHLGPAAIRASSFRKRSDQTDKQAAEEFLKTLDYMHRRLFLSVLACYKKVDDASPALGSPLTQTLARTVSNAARKHIHIKLPSDKLSKESFAHIIEGCSLLKDAMQRNCNEFSRYMNFLDDQVDDKDKVQIVNNATLIKEFGIPETSDIPIDAFRPFIYEEFGEQALSFGFSATESQRVERQLEEMNAAPNVLVPPSHAVSPVKGGVEASPLHSNIAEPNFNVSEEEFCEIWRNAKGVAPSEQALNRVFSLFPEEGGVRAIDMKLFLRNCQESIFTHKNMSFARHFCTAEMRRLYSVTWIMFYVPFFALSLFILFYSSSLGDSIWLTQGLSTTFAPSSAASTNDVQTWLTTSVGSIWPVDSQPAALHNNANYFVGTLRIRQHRVYAADCSQQFADYFGDSVTKQLKFSSDNNSTSKRSYYQTRVQRDYKSLFDRQECFAAYDFGGRLSTFPFVPSNNSLLPETLKAFTFQSSSYSNEINGHDSKYPEGGFVLELNFTVLGAYAKRALSEVFANNWLDNSTRVVVLDFIVLNYNLNVLCGGRFGFETTSGGMLYPLTSTSVTHANYPSGGLFVTLSVVMFILVLFYIVAVITAVYRNYQSRRALYGENGFFAGVRAFFGSASVMLDTTIIILTIIGYAMKFTTAAGSKLNTISNGGQWAQDIDTALLTAQTAAQLQGASIFLVFLRFLYFSGQHNRRFAVVYNTLARAAADLGTIISLWIFAIFACTLSGVVLFGYGTSEAFNIQTEFFDLFNTASGGNPMYTDYAANRRIASPIFWTVYFVVCFFMLYNMVVAVLTGKFADVKDEMFNEQVVEQVLKQESQSAWMKINLGVKARLLSTIVIQEFVYLYRLFRYRGNVPLRMKCENPRLCWMAMSDKWKAIDCQLPEDVIAAAVDLIGLWATIRVEQDAVQESWKKVRLFKNQMRFLGKMGAGDAKDGTTDENASQVGAKDRKASIAQIAIQNQRSLAVEKQQPEEKSEGLIPAIITFSSQFLAPDQTTMRKLTAKEAQRENSVTLKTFADRRLPTWEEYKFYMFEEEHRNVNRYLVYLPGLLMAWSFGKLWRHAVEERHYFRLLTKDYTVDISDSRLSQLTKLLPAVGQNDRDE